MNKHSERMEFILIVVLIALLLVSPLFYEVSAGNVAAMVAAILAFIIFIVHDVKIDIREMKKVSAVHDDGADDMIHHTRIVLAQRVNMECSVMESTEQMLSIISDYRASLFGDHRAESVYKKTNKVIREFCAYIKRVTFLKEDFIEDLRILDESGHIAHRFRESVEQYTAQFLNEQVARVITFFTDVTPTLWDDDTGAAADYIEYLKEEINVHLKADPKNIYLQLLHTKVKDILDSEKN